MASKNGAGCLIPFGLVFLIVGCIPGWFALSSLRLARATQGWTQTTATILHVELAPGDETISINCRYRYRVSDRMALEPGVGKDYEGTRVGIHGGSDNVGEWQLETFHRLETAAKREEPVPCWYDPADPSQAVLDRDERWEMIGFLLIFPIVFGLAGGGIAWLGLHQWRKARRAPVDPQVQAQQAVIQADGGQGCAMWIFAIIWNTISWAAVAGVLFKGNELPWPVILLVAIFPLIGLAMLWTSIRSSLRSLRHGRPQLRLDSGSWSTGRRVRATVLTRTRPEPGDRIAARLLVTRSVTTGSGDDSSTSTSTQLDLELAIDAQAGRSEGDAWAHSLELPLPSDLDPSDDAVTWKLAWQLIRPGPDLSVNFLLPVIAGSDGVELKAFDLRLAADRAAPLAVLTRAGLRVAEDGGAVVITAPAGRNPGLYVTGLIASAVLSAGAVALWQYVSWWTVLFSAPIVLLCWRGAVRSALWRSTITLGSGRIAVSAGWWRLRTHELKASEITEVERKTSMTSGETSWHNMWLKTEEGERIAIVRGVPGPAAARLAEMINAARQA